MKECPNCHCQVVSEVKVCPYCSTELDYVSDRTETVFAARNREVPVRKLNTGNAYGTANGQPVVRPAGQPSRQPAGQPVAQPVRQRAAQPAVYPQQYGGGDSRYMSSYPPNYGWRPAYEERSYTPYQEKNEQKGNSLIYILVALLGCMIVANVLELVAILLLLR